MTIIQFVLLSLSMIDILTAQSGLTTPHGLIAWTETLKYSVSSRIESSMMKSEMSVHTNWPELVPGLINTV